MSSKMSRSSGRKKKPSSKLKESEWSTALDTEVSNHNSRTHILSTKHLEPEDSEDLKDSDLQKGNTLLWKVKGKRYTSTLLEVYDSKPPLSSKRDHDVDSSNSESEENPVKKCKVPPAPVTKVYGSSSDDDDHSTDSLNLDKDTLNESFTTGTPSSKDFIDLLTKVSSLENSIQGMSSKVDQVYTLVLKKSYLTPPTPPTSSTSSPQASDAEYLSVKEEGDNSKYISESGVNLLSIRAMNPQKYALSLMDALFTDEEMAIHCFSCGSRGTKPKLPQEKVKLIEECIDKKYGTGTFVANEREISRKCNQKCIDVANKRIKRSTDGAKDTAETEKRGKNEN